MKTASRFRRLPEPDTARTSRTATPTIAFSWNGEQMQGHAGDTVAAALLANGVTSFRETTVSGAPRGPFCMMGSCFDCLVTVDGEPDRQACMTTLAEGMTVTSGIGPTAVASAIREAGKDGA